jgi:hypothetical protein
MWMIYFVVVLALVGSSIILLITSLNTITNALVLGQVGRVVTSVILLVFSLGLFRFTLGYYSFCRSAERIEEAAKALVAHPPVEQVGILKLWQDYQLARALAPIIPTWMWKCREKKLNKLWATYRA